VLQWSTKDQEQLDAGADDPLAAPPGHVAARLPSGRALVLAGDHLGVPATQAVTDAIVQEARA
jgi:hypothetical protein